MTYDFDELLERRGTDSVKWDGVRDVWGRDDLLPLWVADMDFRTPPFVMDALQRQLSGGVLGYTRPCADWAPAIRDWLLRRHGWQVETGWISFVPGIVRAQALALLCFTRPGDRVAVMNPVYHPFFLVTQRLEREVVFSPLVLRDGHYHIDCARLEQDLDGCRVLILCNPHNPGGRVWTEDELRRVADICHRRGVMVLSDEIHADLTLPGYCHRPFATVSPQAAAISLTFMAPSKAFNMPGLASSYAIAVDLGIRRRFQTFLEAGEFGEGHMLAYVGCAAAYREGEEWLGQLLAYLQGNIDLTEQFLKERIPTIGMIRPQASYLIFLDCRRLGLSQPELVNLFVDKARLALNDGTMFGRGGEGFMRLNVGCPRSVLRRALEQLEEALSHL